MAKAYSQLYTPQNAEISRKKTETRTAIEAWCDGDWSKDVPVTTSTVSIEGRESLFDLTLREIGVLCKLEDDWDEEGAPAIAPASILKAQNFVTRLSDSYASSYDMWEAPSVYANLRRGVELLWRIERKRLSLTFAPETCEVEIVQKDYQEAPTHSFASDEKARDIVLEFVTNRR